MIGNLSTTTRPRKSSKHQNGNDKHEDVPKRPTPNDQNLDEPENDSEDERLLRLVRDTQKEATKIRLMRRSATLESALLESRDLVLKEQLKKLKRQNEGGHYFRPNIYPRLPSTQCPDRHKSTLSAVASDYKNDDDVSNIADKWRVRETRKRSSSSIINYSEISTKKSKKLSPIQYKLFDSKTLKDWARVENHQPLYLEATVSPTPPSTATVFLKSQYAVEDMQDLMHVPYFNDHDEDNIISEHFDTRRREALMEDGPLYQKKATDDAIDETLTLLLCSEKLNLGSGKRTRRNKKQSDNEAIHVIKRMQHHLAKLMNIRIERVLKRYDVIKSRLSDKTEFGKDNDSINKCDDIGSLTRTVYNSEEICKLSKNDDKKMNSLYIEHVMDSFRNLFCRRCFTYDCSNHGNLPPPDIELQTKQAVEKELSSDWVDLEDRMICNSCNLEQECISRPQSEKRRTSSNSSVVAKTTIIPHENEELDGFQRAICDHTFQIFKGDTDKIAAVIGCNAKSLQSYIKRYSIKLKDLDYVQEQSSSQECKKKKKKVCDKTSMKYYNSSWLKRVQDAELRPSFDPCNHEGPCSFETCSCVQNAHFCTKHCVWGAKSRNFFRGCSCKVGQCRRMSCTCFAANRECDPDLCLTCGACTDPPNKIATQQRCRNDNISMRRHCHLLLAKSGVSSAGWGIYTKHALKKGDFIHEYIGEVISQEEAERRGTFYDKENRSYLFNLNSEKVVDARRKGNKTKFANHSSNPNCGCKVITVNGDCKIGLFAKEDIEAQTELFFDYRYDVSVSHELLIKPSKIVEWMKKPKAVKRTHV